LGLRRACLSGCAPSGRRSRASGCRASARRCPWVGGGGPAGRCPADGNPEFASVSGFSVPSSFVTLAVSRQSQAHQNPPMCKPGFRTHHGPLESEAISWRPRHGAGKVKGQEELVGGQDKRISRKPGSHERRVGSTWTTLLWLTVERARSTTILDAPPVESPPMRAASTST
jgi:hypothetical protein